MVQFTEQDDGFQNLLRAEYRNNYKAKTGMMVSQQTLDSRQKLLWFELSQRVFKSAEVSLTLRCHG